MSRSRLSWIGCAFAAAILLPHAAGAADWPMFGASVSNHADNPAETRISTKNAPKLAQKWVATTGGDVSARAAVVDGVAYFPDWAGNFWALDTNTGKPRWHRNLTQYGFTKGTVSRTSPAVENGTVYFGTQLGAYMVAVDAKTGDLKWHSQIDSHPEAIITSSPAVANGILYFGVASNEEGAASNPGYHCCSFRGSAVAVDAATGQIIWKTFIVPTNYAGGAVWGSNLVVDAARGEIFLGTGNNYITPNDPAYAACIATGGKPQACYAKDDHFDSLLALNMKNGNVKWSHRLSNSDDWTVACITAPDSVNCPTGFGPDYDFGSGPQEITLPLSGGRTRTVIGAGQKSGVYSAFDADTGAMMWATKVGPGASLGGIEWGSATDGKRIYVAISNANGEHYKGGVAGSWNALDPLTGAVLWRVPDPNGADDLGPLAVANGVVYAPSMGGAPSMANMFALNAATGDILWSFPSGGSVNAGATIVDGSVYWGSGYSHIARAGFIGNTKFYAFGLNGK